MIRKTATGEAEAKRRQGAVDGREIVAAIRDGSLTRGQFDAWRSLRRRTAGNIVITLRDSKPPRRAARRHKGRR
ncbi:MAG: hypothetical protein HYV14_17305 [Elusimicrobia bacterium]|nr:hypothetical protein [Elusimicrobiota bacterium]